MDIVAGWLGILVGAALLTWSTHTVTASYRGRRVPFWVSADRRFGQAVWLRMSGAFALISGAGVLSTAIGYWSVAIVAAAFVPGLMLIVLHNRRLSAQM